jgi:flavodoxin
MRFLEFRQILTEEAKVGREYQHLEDLVFVDGAAGANEAADILDKLGTDSSDVSIKWDGNPTVYWGREPNGQFVLVGKNGWGRNKSTSADDLERFITSTGKGEDWRTKFGSDMAGIFRLMEQSTPPDFRGYVYGDLLWHPGKPFQTSKEGIRFTPNSVTYTVSTNSPLGKRIAGSKVGVVVHSQYDEFGSKAGTPIEDTQALNSKDAVVLGQTYVAHQPNVDTSAVKEIRNLAAKNGKTIDQFLAPVAGLSDMKNIIYTYVNQQSKGGNLQGLGSNFFEWLQTSKVSPNKQTKIAEMNKANPKALPAVFELVRKIMAVKNDLIDQLDSADADVKATTKGERGGEGYVALGSKTKLVPRHRWTPN